jgi:hypothetical protein
MTVSVMGIEPCPSAYVMEAGGMTAGLVGRAVTRLPRRSAGETV